MLNRRLTRCGDASIEPVKERADTGEHGNENGVFILHDGCRMSL